jgi:hypothetical protein
MKTLITSVLFTIVSVFGFSQSKYDFDIPARAKSDEKIFEWFIEKLDSTSDSLLYKMFEMTNTHTDSIHWEYTTSLVDSLTLYGQDYYSANCYYVNTNEKIITNKFFPGRSKLDRKLYSLIVSSNPNGGRYLILVEYF